MRSSAGRARVVLFSPDDSLLRDFEREGIRAEWVPLVELAPRRGSSLDVLRALEECGVVAFTSPRALKMLLSDARDHGVEERLLEALRHSVVGAVGPKTYESVRETLGRDPDIIAPESYSRSLAKTLADRGYSCVVAPRSAAGVRDFSEELEERGVKLYEIPVYEPRVVEESLATLREMLLARRGERLVLALTSPMIADIVCSILSERVFDNIALVAIGATTARAVESRCPESYDIRVGDGTPSTLVKIVLEIAGDESSR